MTQYTKSDQLLWSLALANPLPNPATHCWLARLPILCMGQQFYVGTAAKKFFIQAQCTSKQLVVPSNYNK